MSQSRIIISEIDDDITEDQLKDILTKAQVPFQNQSFKIMKPKHQIGSERKNKRFTVLNFDSDEVARNAVDLISQLQYKSKNSNSKASKFSACMFVPDFKNKIEQGTGLCVFNLPSEIKQSDVYELFSQFGQVLMIQLQKDEKRKTNTKDNKEEQHGIMAKILYSKKEEADLARESVNEKYLGKNQVFVKEYHTLQWRLQNNCDVMIKNCPEDTTQEDVVSAIQGLGFQDFLANDEQAIYISQPIPTFDGYVKFAIFTCVDKDIAEQIVKKSKEQQPEIKNQKLESLMKLTKGMIAYLKATDNYSQAKVDNKRNIQVYGVARNNNVSTTQVYDFFSQFGEIESFTAPKIVGGEYNQDLAHFNIQYKTEDDAKKALEHAVEEEQKLVNRLSESELRVEIYQQQNVVKSSDKHTARDE